MTLLSSEEWQEECTQFNSGEEKEGTKESTYFGLFQDQNHATLGNGWPGKNPLSLTGQSSMLRKQKTNPTPLLLAGRGEHSANLSHWHWWERKGQRSWCLKHLRSVIQPLTHMWDINYMCLSPELLTGNIRYPAGPT